VLDRRDVPFQQDATREIDLDRRNVLTSGGLAIVGRDEDRLATLDLEGRAVLPRYALTPGDKALTVHPPIVVLDVGELLRDLDLVHAGVARPFLRDVAELRLVLVLALDLF